MRGSRTSERNRRHGELGLVLATLRNTVNITEINLVASSEARRNDEVVPRSDSEASDLFSAPPSGVPRRVSEQRCFV